MEKIEKLLSVYVKNQTQENCDKVIIEFTDRKFSQFMPILRKYRVDLNMNLFIKQALDSKHFDKFSKKHRHHFLKVEGKY